jgi:hypothetical protein
MVCVTSWAWFSILDLAEQHGWRPYGAVQAEWLWSSAGLPVHREGHDLMTGDYAYEQGRLVMLEDALNLGDALERAFLAYEPERLPSYTDMTMFAAFDPGPFGKPGIGVLLEIADLCQSGAFWIESW